MTQELNPMVRVVAASLDEEEVKKTASQYDVIIFETEISEIGVKRWISLNDFIAELKIPNRPYLICTSVVGFYGMVFTDLGFHEFLS